MMSCVLTSETKEGEKIACVPVVDALGREVMIPDTIRKVVCLGPSAIRMVTYSGGVPFICAVEKQETIPHPYTHQVAYPELKELPMIVPDSKDYPDRIAENAPDLIFLTTSVPGEADELQLKTRVPVIALDDGDMGGNRGKFYASLRLIGSVLRTSAKVDSLIRYIDSQISDLASRARSDAPVKRPNVYVGGISVNGGIRDLTSTDPFYPAFRYIRALNVASEIESQSLSARNGLHINEKKLLDWNPEIMFIDVSAAGLVRESFHNRISEAHFTDAYKRKRVFVLWPSANSHANFEVMLINAWYAGSILYPENFEDIDVMEKADEVLTAFVGKPIAGNLAETWGPYRNLWD